MSDTAAGPDWDGLEPEIEAARTSMGRAIMKVLTDRGHYEETPEDFVWATVDAGRVVQFITERGLTYRNMFDALVDTGLHEESNSCLQADVAAFGALL